MVVSTPIRDEPAAMVDHQTLSKVTVLVTTFNQLAFVDEAIRSVLMQETSFPFEILVADDGSTDGTRRIVSQWRDAFPERIRCFFPEQNMGYRGGAMFQEALTMCRSPFLALLDGDDYWTSPHKLQRQVDLLERRPECSGAFHPVDLLDQATGRIVGVFPAAVSKETYSLDDFIFGTGVQSSSTVFRTDLLPELPDWIFTSSYADWGFQAAHAAHAPLALLPERMGVYRKHREGVWNGLDQVRRLEILVEQTARVPERFPQVDPRRARRSLALRCFELALKYGASGRYRDAVRAVGRGLRSGRSITTPLLFCWRWFVARRHRTLFAI